MTVESQKRTEGSPDKYFPVVINDSHHIYYPYYETAGVSGDVRLLVTEFDQTNSTTALLQKSIASISQFDAEKVNDNICYKWRQKIGSDDVLFMGTSGLSGFDFSSTQVITGDIQNSDFTVSPSGSFFIYTRDNGFSLYTGTANLTGGDLEEIERIPAVSGMSINLVGVSASKYKLHYFFVSGDVLYYAESTIGITGWETTRVVTGDFYGNTVTMKASEALSGVYFAYDQNSDLYTASCSLSGTDFTEVQQTNEYASKGYVVEYPDIDLTNVLTGGMLDSDRKVSLVYIQLDGDSNPQIYTAEMDGNQMEFMETLTITGNAIYRKQPRHKKFGSNKFLAWIESEPVTGGGNGGGGGE